MICGEKFRKVKLTEPLGMVDKSIRIESGNKKLIESNLGYDLSQTLDEIRPTYRFNESCQDTVPQAIIAFLESTDFEDAIRNAISLGGTATRLQQSLAALQRPPMVCRIGLKTGHWVILMYR